MATVELAPPPGFVFEDEFEATPMNGAALAPPPGFVFEDETSLPPPSGFVPEQDLTPTGEPQTEQGAITRGFLQALGAQTPRSVGGAIESVGRLQPWDFAEAPMLELAEGLRILGEENARTQPKLQVPSISDIPPEGGMTFGNIPETLSRAGTFAGESLGSGLGSMVPQLAGTLLGAGTGLVTGGPVAAGGGAVAGGAGASYILNQGDLYESLKEEAVKYSGAHPDKPVSLDDMAKISMVGAIPVAALDAVSFKGLLPGVKDLTSLAGLSPKDAAKYLFKEYLKGAGTEAGTEAGQQAIQIGTQAATFDRAPTKEELVSIPSAGVAGGITGGTVRAGGQVPTAAAGMLRRPPVAPTTTPSKAPPPVQGQPPVAAQPPQPAVSPAPPAAPAAPVVPPAVLPAPAPVAPPEAVTGPVVETIPPQPANAPQAGKAEPVLPQPATPPQVVKAEPVPSRAGEKSIISPGETVTWDGEPVTVSKVSSDGSVVTVETPDGPVRLPAETVQRAEPKIVEFKERGEQRQPAKPQRKLKQTVDIPLDPNPREKAAKQDYEALPPVVSNLYHDIGDTQRGAPEIAMTQAQSVIGTGVMSSAIENTGDLINRATAHQKISHGYDMVVPKLKTISNLLKRPYGFAREFRENIESNARYRGTDTREAQHAAFAALKKYADEHRKLPVYNELQYRAREAAVALGEQRFDDAERHIDRLSEMAKSYETYKTAATDYELDMEGRPIPFAESTVAVPTAKPKGVEAPRGEAQLKPEEELPSPVKQKVLQEKIAEEKTYETEAPKELPKFGRPEDLAETGGATFEDFAKNRTININKAIFEEAGHDPTKAANYPPKKQKKIIVDTFMEKFGLKVEFDGKLNIKDEIDQLADMFVGLNNMAYSLGLPPTAMSLDGRIVLHITGKRPYLGAYHPVEKSITIPDKSNSYAHEWMHAFDHFLLDKHGASLADLFSGKVRKEGADISLPLPSAFVDVMNALFFDEAALAQEVLALEVAAAKPKDTKVKAEAQRKLEQIKKGNYRGLKTRGEFYKTSKAYGKEPDDTTPDETKASAGRLYWTQPEEMLARATEAYTGWKLANLEVGTKGLSKPTRAYESAADARLAQTFPKLGDRVRIFEALDKLFAAVADQAIMGDAANDQRLIRDPEFLGIYDPRFWKKTAGADNAKKMGWIRAALSQTWKEVKQQSEDIRENRVLKRMAQEEKQKDKKAVEGPPPSIPVRIWNGLAVSPAAYLWNHMFRTERTVAHAIEKKINSSALRMMNDRIFSRPGEGIAVRVPYSQRLAAQVNKAATILERLYKDKHFGGLVLKSTENDQLRNAMLDLETQDAGRYSANTFSEAARDLRLFADSIWKRMREAGLEVGYTTKGAWLRRHYLTDRVLARADAFLEAAAKTYVDQFNEVFPDAKAAAGNVEEFITTVKALVAADPEGNIIDLKILEDVLKAKSKFDAALNTTDKTAARTELETAIGKILADVRNAYADLSAKSWLGQMQSRKGTPEHETLYPIPGFMKSRGLPASADVHLKEFMETDVLKILQQYAIAAETAIAQKEVYNPKGAPSMEQLRKQALAEGVNKDDIDDLFSSKDAIGMYDAVVKGYNMTPRMRRIGRAVTFLRALAIIKTLGKIVFSAMVEPMVIGVKTRSVFRGLRAYADSLADVVGTNNAAYYREIAYQIGALGNDLINSVMLEREGGGFETTPYLRDAVSKFMRMTGATGITENQSVVATIAGARWFNYTADKYINGSESDKKLAERDFAEHGIKPREAAAFARWILASKGRPDLSAVGNDSAAVFAGKYAEALLTFRNNAIQHPKREDRPALANHPVGAVLYTGLGFTFSFWDNVVKAEAVKYKDMTWGQRAKTASNHLATVGVMVAIGVLMNTLRMMLFDRDKYEELKEKDPEKLDAMIIGRAVENVNLLGPSYSILYNMWKGVEYGRDPATSASGLVLSSYLNLVQRGIELAGAKNSPNTTTAEHNFIVEAYRTLAAPIVTAALTQLPGPAKLISLPVGVASMYINSNTMANELADALGYPKGKTVDKDIAF